MNGHKIELKFWPARRRFFQRRRLEVVITRQHQNPFIRFRIATQFIQQRFQLIVRQQRDGLFIPRRQAVKRFRQLMRVLLNKTVGYFANPRVEAVGGVQIAAIAFPKIVVEGRREDSCAPLKR